MLQQQITSWKQVNLEIQNDLEELEQNGRRLNLRIDGLPIKEKERSQDDFEHVVGMFEEVSAENVDDHIDRAHRISNLTSIKSLQKNVKALLLNLQHSGIAQ